MYFKGGKEFHSETDWDELWPKQYMAHVDKCDDEKKWPIPGLKQLVDSVF